MYQGFVGAHSRAIQFFFPDSEVAIGRSAEAPQIGFHPEHLVPCAYIRDLTFSHFQQRALVVDAIEDIAYAQELATLLKRLLAVAKISQGEKDLLDSGTLPYNSKSSMPKDWDPINGNILVRLHDIGISELLPL